MTRVIRGYLAMYGALIVGAVMSLSYVYTKLVNFLRRKHKRRGKGFRAFPPSFFKKAGLYQLHGIVVHSFRTPRGEHGREAG